MAGNSLVQVYPFDTSVDYDFLYSFNKALRSFSRDDLAVDTEGILYGTLNTSWTVLSELNDLPETHPLATIKLFDGCGIWNHNDDCSAVCSDHNTLFQSWRTVWHCLNLASLSLAKSTFPNLTESISREIDETLERFNISKDTQFNDLAVFNATYSCAAASCRDESMATCIIPDLSEQAYVHGDRVDWSVLYLAISPTICGNLTEEVNLDIAGPGVSAAISSRHYAT